MERITSVKNNRVKQLIRLRDSARYRTLSGCFIAEGLRLCTDAVRCGLRPQTLYVTAAFMCRHPEAYEMLTGAAEDCVELAPEVFAKVTDTASPQGVLCVLPILDRQIVLQPAGRYVALVELADPANLGAVSRTAEALGVDGMLVCGGCDICNSKALRSSMGALFRLPVQQVESPQALLSWCKRSGLKTFASTPRDTATPLSVCGCGAGSVLLIGNEANGLSQEIIDACDVQVTIPMAGRAESLNAAAAAAILMYEMMHSEGADGGFNCNCGDG